MQTTCCTLPFANILTHLICRSRKSRGSRKNYKVVGSVLYPAPEVSTCGRFLQSIDKGVLNVFVEQDQKTITSKSKFLDRECCYCYFLNACCFFLQITCYAFRFANILYYSC
jgi:hypothetical protein